MDTPTATPSTKTDQLVERYFALADALPGVEDKTVRDKYIAALKQIEDHLLEHGTAEHLVRLYVHKRDEIDAIKKECDARKAAAESLQASIEGRLKRVLREQGLTSSATEYGTFFTKNMTSVTVADKEAFRTWVQEDPDRWAFLDLKANKTAVVTHKEENNGALPAGLNWREEEVLQVRRA